MVDCGKAGLRAALTAPSGLDELIMLLGVRLSAGFRRDGSRIGGGFDVGVAKSWAAIAAEEVFSEDESGDTGTFGGGEAIAAMQDAGCKAQGRVKSQEDWK